MDDGEMAMEKFCTVRVKVTVRTMLPFVPVTVMVELAPGVAAVVVMVSTLLAEPLTDGGTKPAEAPAGRPLAEKEVEPPNPALAVTAIVRVPLCPATTVSVPAGVAAREKPFVTTSVAGVVCEGQPLQVPVTLNG
jgi:hypothetical protein